MNEPSQSHTIASVLDEFLQDWQLRLRPRTFSQYQSVIDLLQLSLERSTEPADSDLIEAIEKAREAGRDDAVCSLCSPSEIANGMHEFLGWFMIRHVDAGPSLMRSVSAVTRKLAQWLAERHYLDEGHQALLDDVVDRKGPVLPKVVTMRDRLAKWVDQQSSDLVAGAIVVEGHFTVDGVTTDGWKISGIGNTVSGVVRVPPQWLHREQEDWEIGGVVAIRGKRLEWVEIWNIYP